MKNILAVIVVLLVLFAWVTLGHAQPSAWERIDPIAPPDEFGFQSIAASGDGTVYLGTDSGGLFKSANYGTSWQQIAPSSGPCNAGIFNGSIWSVAVDRFNGTLYANNGYGCQQGIHKSTDGGSTWTQALPQGFNGDIGHVTTDPYTSGHVITSVHGGAAQVYESMNSGATWTARTAPGAGVPGFLDNASTWLLSTSGGYYRTTNNGQTWTQVSSLSMQHGATQIVRFKGSWYASIDNGVIVSPDGVSWTFRQIAAFSYFSGLATDGQNLYTRSAYPVGLPGEYQPGQPMKYSADGVTWQNGATGMGNGPALMAVDSQYVYSANMKGGVWRLPVSGGSPATPSPSSTPVVSTSTPTLTPVATSTSTLTSTPTPLSTSTSTPTVATPTSTPTPSSLLCYESADGGLTIIRVAC